MKYVYLAVISILVAIFGIQLYNLNIQKSEIKRKVHNVSSELEVIKNENLDLIADFEYFSDFDNLAKEFKSLFNYRLPGEELIIIVPKNGEGKIRE